MPYQGCEGTPDWVDVLALGRKRRLRSSRFVLVIQWTAAGRRGAGGGWVAAAVAAARVGRSRGAVVQFIDKVVIVLLQLKFQQSRVCTGSSSTECWTFRLCSERSTHSANCAEDCSCVDVHVISSDKFPLSRGLNPLAPDSAHPQSGEHSCCVLLCVVVCCCVLLCVVVCVCVVCVLCVCVCVCVCVVRCLLFLSSSLARDAVRARGVER